MSTILVEHKLDVVRNLARRVVVMDNGQVLVEGPPDEVLADLRVVEAYLGKRGAEEARAMGLAP
jgi:branched-chain amino acid transport system ATP-binding protein